MTTLWVALTTLWVALITLWVALINEDKGLKPLAPHDLLTVESRFQAIDDKP